MKKIAKNKVERKKDKIEFSLTIEKQKDGSFAAFCSNSDESVAEIDSIEDVKRIAHILKDTLKNQVISKDEKLFNARNGFPQNISQKVIISDNDLAIESYKNIVKHLEISASSIEFVSSSRHLLHYIIVLYYKEISQKELKLIKSRIETLFPSHSGFPYEIRASQLKLI